MRILIPFRYVIQGGITRASLLLIRELLKKADAVVILLPRESIALLRDQLPTTDRLAFVANARSSRHFGRFADMIEGLLVHLQSLFLIKRHRITHCVYPYPACLRLGFHSVLRFSICLAVVVHDLYWKTYQHRGSSLVRADQARWYARLAATADLLVASSLWTLSELRECASGGRAKLECIPLATEQAPLAGARNGFPGLQPKGRFLFYYPAGVYENKNHLLLFQAAKVLAEKGHSFGVALSGPGVATLDREHADPAWLLGESARKYYQEHKAVLRDHISFMGYLDYRGVEDCYASCDCVVLPSSYEGFGLPLSEALARCVPVVSSDIPVFREQVARYRCEDVVIFFRCGDLDSLTAGMEEVIENPRPRVNPDVIRERFEAWTPAEYGKEWVDLLQSL